MIKVEENKDQHNEISTSTNKLNEVETEDEKDKNDKITLEDLTNIISEPDDKKDDDNYDDHDHEHEHEHEHDQDHEKEHENEHEHDTHIRKKDSADLSNDDMIESELRMIRKKNLDKYVLFGDKFKSNTESEEELSKQSKNDNSSQRQLYKFVGRTLFVFLDKGGNPLMIIGPHWPMYACFCGIISIIFLGIYLTLWKNLGLVMQVLGHICFWTYFISYTHCSLCNPGYPKNDIGRRIGQPRDQYYLCTLCHFYVKKSRYAHHCFDCDICIENHDHHCPWTGHCIGRNNYYSFFVFVGSSFLIIIYLAGAICVGASQYN